MITHYAKRVAVLDVIAAPSCALLCRTPVKCSDERGANTNYSERVAEALSEKFPRVATRPLATFQGEISPMLTQTELMRLDASLRHTQTLSVYLGCPSVDPAERSTWRRELASALKLIRKDIRDHPHEERERFSRAVVLLEERLSSYAGAPQQPGWACFATAQGVSYEEVLPVAISFGVTWREGISIAPYLDALEKLRPAVAAIVDSRVARLYRYEHGALEKLEILRAHVHVGPVEHMGRPPATGFHTGTRGSAGSDEADRELRSGRERLTRQAAEHLASASSPDAWIMVGGIPEDASEVLGQLPDSVLPRARRLLSVGVHAAEAAIKAGVEEGATDLRRSRELATVDEIFRRCANAGTGTLGLEPTQLALRTASADRVCMTDRFIHERQQAAEELVRVAFASGAEVEVVSGAAADRLDTRAGGIGARLRYVPLSGPE